MNNNTNNNDEWQNPLMDFLYNNPLLQNLKSEAKPKVNIGRAEGTPVQKPASNAKKSKNNYDSQGIVNVKSIKNGIIICSDGSYVKILEVLPLNYYQKDNSEKNKITADFERFFRTCPENIHIKTRTEKSDVNKIINAIRENYQKEDNMLLQERAEEYINHIQMLQNQNTIDRRFYIIFKYEGDNGNISRDFNVIYRSMKNIELNMRSNLISMGNLVVTSDNEDYHACEILYKFYNPISCSKETLRNRIDRLHQDYNTIQNPQGTITEADYIAPRGLSSKITKEWMLMDGMYHTWLILKDNSYPEIVQTGWLDNIPSYLGVDIDIFAKRCNRKTVLAALDQIKRFKYSSYNASKTNPTKVERIGKEIENAEYINSIISNFDEDLFNTVIIITIRSETFENMQDMRNRIKSHLDGLSIYTSTSFLTAHECLKSVAPDMYISNPFFKKYSRNMLTRNMAQLYCFTSMSLFDNEGYVIGRNVQGGSLVSFNNFNTNLYSNGNIVIMGTPGSGKSFFEMMLGYRMRMMGIRTMYILPLKAHEYYHACERIGGEYIKFIPGGQTCVNIMEIRPQVTANGELLEDIGDMDGMDAPLLARKIASLCAWLQLNMMEDKLTTAEKNRFNTLCTKLYANYGITSDNDSIWLDKQARKLRPMPILQDLNDALQEDIELSRIRDVLSPYMHGGMFSNFNGQTNVNLNNQFLIFDVDKTSINEDYLPAMMYIAFDCCYDLAKQNLYHKDAIFMDEVWLMMQNEDCAKQVKEMVKIIRGYGACSILATQDIGDFMRSNNGLGESILAASKIKFFLRMEDMEINNIAKVVDLNNNDKNNFKKFPSHGRTLLMSGKDKILIDMIASDSEVRTFTTDINLRKKINNR